MKKEFFHNNKIVNFILIICFLFNTLSTSAFGAIGPITPAYNLSGLQLPLLRYLSINSNNPYNYFNFLLDKGEVSQAQALNTQAKRLINYFFLGISLSSDAFWVNLQPKDQDKMTSEELSRTDMGRVLLEQDLQLKKDVAKYLHPDNTLGKKFWEKLYTQLGKDKVKREKITTSQRVWIVPDSATVVETADGAFISEAKLKVLLENEYFTQISADKNHKISTDETSVAAISEKLMKEIIIPQLSSDVNYLPRYSALRQIYYSLILAGYFKRKHANSTNPTNATNATDPYISLIDQNTTQGLESELPWSKDAIWQEYLTSYSKGEYQIKRSLLGLARMYFSGGIQLGSVTVNSPLIMGDAMENKVTEIISADTPFGKAQINPTVEKNLTTLKLNGDGSKVPGEIELLVEEGETGEEPTTLAASPVILEDLSYDKALDKIIGELKVGKGYESSLLKETLKFIAQRKEETEIKKFLGELLNSALTLYNDLVMNNKKLFAHSIYAFVHGLSTDIIGIEGTPQNIIVEHWNAERKITKDNFSVGNSVYEYLVNSIIQRAKERFPQTQRDAASQNLESPTQPRGDKNTDQVGSPIELLKARKEYVEQNKEIIELRKQWGELIYKIRNARHYAKYYPHFMSKEKAKEVIDASIPQRDEKGKQLLNLKHKLIQSGIRDPDFQKIEDGLEIYIYDYHEDLEKREISVDLMTLSAEFDEEKVILSGFSRWAAGHFSSHYTLPKELNKVLAQLKQKLQVLNPKVDVNVFLDPSLRNAELNEGYLQKVILALKYPEFFEYQLKKERDRTILEINIKDPYFPTEKTTLLTADKDAGQAGSPLTPEEKLTQIFLFPQEKLNELSFLIEKAREIVKVKEAYFKAKSREIDGFDKQDLDTALAVLSNNLTKDSYKVAVYNMPLSHVKDERTFIEWYSRDIQPTINFGEPARTIWNLLIEAAGSSISRWLIEDPFYPGDDTVRRMLLKLLEDPYTAELIVGIDDSENTIWPISATAKNIPGIGQKTIVPKHNYSERLINISARNFIAWLSNRFSEEFNVVEKDKDGKSGKFIFVRRAADSPVNTQLGEEIEELISKGSLYPPVDIFEKYKKMELRKAAKILREGLNDDDFGVRTIAIDILRKLGIATEADKEQYNKSKTAAGSPITKEDINRVVEWLTPIVVEGGWTVVIKHDGTMRMKGYGSPEARQIFSNPPYDVIVKVKQIAQEITRQRRGDTPWVMEIRGGMSQDKMVSMLLEATGLATSPLMGKKELASQIEEFEKKLNNLRPAIEEFIEKEDWKAVALLGGQERKIKEDILPVLKEELAAIEKAQASTPKTAEGKLAGSPTLLEETAKAVERILEEEGRVVKIMIEDDPREIARLKESYPPDGIVIFGPRSINIPLNLLEVPKDTSPNKLVRFVLKSLKEPSPDIKQKLEDELKKLEEPTPPIDTGQTDRAGSPQDTGQADRAESPMVFAEVKGTPGNTRVAKKIPDSVINGKEEIVLYEKPHSTESDEVEVLVLGNEGVKRKLFNRWVLSEREGVIYGNYYGIDRESIILQITYDREKRDLILDATRGIKGFVAKLEPAAGSPIQVFELSKLNLEESDIIGYNSTHNQYYIRFFRDSSWAKEHKINQLHTFLGKDGCQVKLYDSSPKFILGVDKKEHIVSLDYRKEDGYYAPTIKFKDEGMLYIDIGLDEEANNGAGAFQFKVTQHTIDSIQKAGIPTSGTLKTGMTWKLVTEFEGSIAEHIASKGATSPLTVVDLTEGQSPALPAGRPAGTVPSVQESLEKLGEFYSKSGGTTFAGSQEVPGGIDLNAVKIQLEQYSSLSAEQKRESIGKIKALLCVDALLDKKWYSLAHLYYQEIVHLIKDKIILDIEERNKLLIAARELRNKGYLVDRQGLRFLEFLEASRPIMEIQTLLSAP